jgi:NADH-quinone oxidoreductase subunit G
MATIIIDHKPYEVKEGDNLLSAVLSAGLDLPYFCWHPALGSIGACRQCAVQHLKDENDTQGRMVMACMTPVAPGMQVSINHPTCHGFRKNVIEWMMQNHPHDCPVCDEGGECHLQDMTVMTGHNYRRYKFKKRTFLNQNLGPFIHHEMNRCITCYRCVRYYQNVAGGDDLAAFSTSNHVYFGRFEDGNLENEFSGNLVEICPTGVFTDKPFRKTYTRKWDLQTAPSVCQLCSVGCNITPGERYQTIRRVQNRYNPHINGYFLCDRGRFGHSFVNSPERLKPSHLAITPLDMSKKIMGIGSPRASLETNFALRHAVGSENFFMGVTRQTAEIASKILSIIKGGPARSASLEDITHADAIFVLGEDVTNTAPMIALAIRQSINKQEEEKAAQAAINSWNDQAVRCNTQLKASRILSATVLPTKLDNLAQRVFFADPDTLAALGFAIAHKICSEAALPEDISPEILEKSEFFAQILIKAQRPVIISGSSLNNIQIIESAANIAWALTRKNIKAQISLAQSEANSLGLTLLGEKNLDDALKAVREHNYELCVIAELDLSRRISPQDFSDFFAHMPEVIAMDSFEHMTTQQAHRTLPTPAFSETTGSLLNYEGRVQRFYKVFAPHTPIPDAWRTIAQLFKLNFKTLDEVTRIMSEIIVDLKPWGAYVYHANFRLEHQKIPRETREYSGRTAMNAHLSMHEQPIPSDPDTPLAHSMEGFVGQPPAALTPFFWAPGWNSNQALNKYQNPVGGNYIHDHLGIRLFESSPREHQEFFVQKKSRKLSPGVFRVVPFYQIFGSEERAAMSPALSARIPEGFLGMSETDAKALKLAHQSLVQVDLKGEKITLPLRIYPELSEGVLSIPIGLLGCASLVLSDTCTISLGEALT